MPVFVDALADLPGDFDQIGATLENAARLHAAGVEVSFAQFGDASHNARKIRQLAGNAVANGLPWEAGLAGLTRCRPRCWASGDRLRHDRARPSAPTWCCGAAIRWTWPTWPQQVWLGGRAMPMRSRQTELRDRYLRAAATVAARLSGRRALSLSEVTSSNRTTAA